MPVIWEGSIAGGGGGEGGISHPKLCAGAGERSGGSGEDSLKYFSLNPDDSFKKDFFIFNYLKCVKNSKVNLQHYWPIIFKA